MTKYYKVVQSDLTSARIHLEGLCVQYQIGKFVKPTFRGSKLCVFDSLYSAQTFNRWGDGRIFECKVKNPTRYLRLTDFLNDILLLWTAFRNKKAYKRYIKVGFMETFILEHTVQCDEVKLLKEVK